MPTMILISLTRKAVAKALFLSCILARVFRREFVSIPTVSSTGFLYGGIPTTDAYSFASADPTKNVFKSGNSLQVKWVNARAHAAFMVYVKPIWNRTFKEFVGYAMRARCSPAAIHCRINNREARIPTTVAGSSPEPTPGKRARRDELHEAFKYADGSHPILLRSIWSGLLCPRSIAGRSYFTPPSLLRGAF